MSAICLEATYAPEDLLTLPDGGKGFELVGGRLVEKKTGSYHSWLAGHVSYFLSHFSRKPYLGWVFDSECGYQCFPDDPLKVRKPDTSFIRRGRLPDERISEGHVLIAPDLSVEVVSPSDTAYEVDHMVNEYLNAGVPWVWVVYPETRTVHVYSSNGRGQRLGEQDELTLPDLMPNLRCKVGELFTLPTPR